VSGLRRAVRELYGEKPERLPRDLHAYEADVRPHDANKMGARRRFPPGSQVSRFFASMTHAWHELGLIPIERVHRSGRHSLWTRDRMIEAGADFFRRFGAAPTSANWWQEAIKGYRNESLPGKVGLYPGFDTIRRFGRWRGMRDFWLDVRHAHPELGIHTDMTDMPWRPIEDWFITESVGILPRDEVVRLMSESGCGRTDAAIKRRLYDLGVNSYSRWGWTINHAERVTGISGETFRKYMAHGRLPYYRSHKCIYIDPADLLVVEEYNWKKKRHPKELDEAVRKSLALRLCYALLGYDWRRYAYHRARPEHEFYAGRVAAAYGKRTPAPLPGPRPEKNKKLEVGHWVMIDKGWKFKTPGARERKGEVKSIYWSSRSMPATQKSPARPPCWMARVELPKVKPHGRPEYRRIIYHVPLDHLTRVRKPRAKKAKPPAVMHLGRRGRLKDLTGLTFGRLKVVRQVESSPRGYRQWLCNCSCGEQTVVRTSYLTQGNTESCGCAWTEAWQGRNARKFVNLTGRRFGRLKVLGPSHVRNKDFQWFVVCDCGKEKTVSGKAMKQGLTRSCGCLQKERASAARKKASKTSLRTKGRFAATVLTRAATLEELPKKYGCNVCGEIKPLAAMVVVRSRKDGEYRLRPRCKECHNAKERGHRREYKKEYLRRWRARNADKDKSYWKDRPDYKERSRASSARYIERHRDALAIRRRLAGKGVEVSVAEAEGLLKKFGPAYPTRFGLTTEGQKRCEHIRAEQRRAGREGRRSSFEIRVQVYNEGLFIEPKLQPRPYQRAAKRLSARRQEEEERRTA
jgi:hypothetical protein